MFLFFLLLFVCLFLLSQTFLYLQRWTSKALSKSSKNAFCSCRRFTHTSDLCSCLSIRCVLFLSSLHCQLLLLSFSIFFFFFFYLQYEKIPNTVGPQVMNYYRGKFYHEVRIGCWCFIFMFLSSKKKEHSSHLRSGRGCLSQHA